MLINKVINVLKSKSSIRVICVLAIAVMILCQLKLLEFFNNSSVPIVYSLIFLWLMVYVFIIIFDIRLNGRLDPFSPMTYYILLALVSCSFFRPIAIINNGWNSLWLSGEHVILPLMEKAIFLNIVGTVSLAAGYYLSFVFIRNRKEKIRIELSEKKVRRIANCIFLIGLFAWLYFMHVSGGLLNYMTSLAYRRKFAEGLGYLTNLIGFTNFSAVFMITYLSKYKSLKFKIFIHFTFSLFILFTMGGRGAIVTALIFFLIVINYSYKKINVLKLGILAVISVVLILGYGELRGQLAGNRSFDEAVTNTIENLNPNNLNIVERLSSNTSNFDRLMIVIDGVPDEIPYQYFTTYSRVVTVFVPRKIWPDKPALTEAAVYAPLFGGDGRTGVYPAGSAGDYYLQLNVLGVIIGRFTTGLLLGWFRMNLLYSNSRYKTIIYAFGMLNFLSGIRNLVIIRFIINMLPLFVVYVLSFKELYKERLINA